MACELCGHSAPGQVGKCSKCGHDPNTLLYKCEGLPNAPCTKKVRWRSTPARVDWGKGSTAMSLTDVKTELGRVLTALGRNTPVAVTDPKIYSLCEPCWAKKAEAWSPGAADVYTTCAARCTDEGLFFNTMRPDYFSGGVVRVDKVKSTVVHEFMHWCSFSHDGLGAEKSPIDWNECMTDLVARRIYIGMRLGTYTTAYGNGSEFLAKATNRINDLGAFALGQLGTKWPQPIPSLLTPNQPVNKPALAASALTAVHTAFANWWMGGPQQILTLGGAPFTWQQFVDAHKSYLFQGLGSKIAFGEKLYTTAS